MLRVLSIGVIAGLSASAPANIVANSLSVGTSGPYVVGDFDFDSLNDQVWFTFTLSTTTSINIDFNRTSAPPDLVANLYSGDINGFDGSGLVPAGVIGSSFGPLSFLEIRDDTHGDAFGGPFGDPQFLNTLDAGTYSIMVSAFQGAGNSFTVTSNVPAPGAAVVLGLGGLFGSRRRR